MLKKFALATALLVSTSCAASFRPQAAEFVSTFDLISPTLEQPEEPMVFLPKGNSHVQYWDKLVKLSPLPVYFADEEVMGNRVGFNTGKAIVLLDTLSADASIKVLVHEIAHSLQPKDIPLEGDPPEGNYFAETVGYLFCKRLGVDQGRFSFYYFTFTIKPGMQEWVMAHTKEIDATVDMLVKGVQ